MKEIRVLVVDDHALIRSGIRALIERHPELQIVADAGDGPEALRLIRQHQPEVALIKSAMSRLNGFGLTERVREECPRVRVIVLSTEADEESLGQALDCGASGYLTMSTSAAELALAIKTVANGKMHISSVATNLLVDFVRYGSRNETLNGLTPRQREVLKLIAEGQTTKQIALTLKISVKTVETHRMLLTDRLDIHHTAGLVRYALKAGLIRLEN